MSSSPVKNRPSRSNTGTAPCLVSFGPLVLDEVIFSDGTTSSNVPGGTGLYATLGGRLVTKPSDSRSVGFLIVAGQDFPNSVLQQIQSWGIDLGVRREPNAPSTRGRLQYHDADFGDKTFAFITPPLHPKPEHLAANSPGLLRAAAFHTLATPENLQTLIVSLQQTCAANNITSRPRLVWEPSPAACKFENLNAHLQACKLVDVFSPNHLEILKLVGANHSSFNRQELDIYAKRFLDSGVGPNGSGAVVIRCGEHGSLAVSRSYAARWFPAFHDQSPRLVVDATGAGNSFLGGFTVGMKAGGGDLTEAVIRGTVAASFVIEQFGLPVRTGTGNSERWNGRSVEARINAYRQRLSMT